MHIAFGCDNAASELKRELMELAQSLGHVCHDCGIREGEANDYPLYAARAARMVQSGQCERGVVVCGTGVGMSLACNKMKGIRCALCSDCYTARMARAHNDANMIAMGARVMGPELAKTILETFLSASFEGGRHQRRLALIERLEAGEALE
ncbi:MAG TPA: ribose 5-phosphate isomerase B [Candidatus Avichristensenella intestinipullorum]|uniref:Ribose 5-phosphate isomerase B n=1 Tax=Candidatus Avichristensenella intestinipullorum TaxID=2840693 RepID=A0A9D0YX15_9FIRM|nr:ribose 5-phosphate isomerase B [Candidatus Avichristensenella intestinipullorum]